MRCYQPTVINVYDCGEEFKLVRRLFNVNHQNIKDVIEHPGDKKLVYLSDKERSKFFDLYHEHLTRVECVVEKSLVIPCGKCVSCNTSHANHWVQRIVADQLVCNKSMYMLTFTYDDEHLPDPASLSKNVAKELTLDLRQAYPGCHYFLCGEYGDHTGRPHYHLLLWNIDDLHCVRDGIAAHSADSILYYVEVPFWSNGHVTAKCVDGNWRGAVAAYCAKYVDKKRSRSDEEKEILREFEFEPEFQFMSRGIGYNYYVNHFDDYDKDHRSHVLSGGVRFTLDRSFLKAKEKFTGVKDDTIFSDILTTISADDNIQRSNSVNIQRLHEGGSRKL